MWARLPGDAEKEAFPLTRPRNGTGSTVVDGAARWLRSRCRGRALGVTTRALPLKP